MDGDGDDTSSHSSGGDNAVVEAEGEACIAACVRVRVRDSRVN